MADDHGRINNLVQEVGRLRSRIRHLEQVSRLQDRSCPDQTTPCASQPTLSEEVLRLTNRILLVSQQEQDLAVICREAVAGIKDLVCCGCVGIRLLDDSGGIPFEAYQGFPRSFYEKESPLSVETDHCMCIEVIQGALDSSQPFVTSGGSFFMNGTTRFLATASEEDKGRPCNVCNQYGYESVALIPIRDREGILGLIHLADTREQCVPEAGVQSVETVALQLGSVIRRLRAERRLREKEATEQALLDAATESAILIDKEMRILAINEVGARRLGSTPEKLIGICADDILPPDLAKSRRQKLVQVLETGQPISFQDRRAERIFYQRMSPIYTPDGTIDKIAVYAQDTTDYENTLKTLQENELRLRLLTETIRDVFWISTCGVGEMVYISPAYEILWERSRASLYESPRSFLEAVHPEDLHAYLACIDEYHRGAKQYEHEYRIIRKDGEVRWIHERGYPVAQTPGRPALMTGICTDTTHRKQAEKRLLDYQEQLKALAKQLTLAEEREKQHVAEALHDDVQQDLAFSRLTLRMMEAEVSEDQVQQGLRQVSEALHRTIESIRSLTFDLNLQILKDLGLEKATRAWLRNQVQKKHGIETVLNVTGEVPALTWENEAILFRSIRELLANAVKHGQPQGIEVSIVWDAEGLMIQVEDNGNGFDMSTFKEGNSPRGFGLFSIRERLEQLGGSMAIDSQRGHGTQVVLSIAAECLMTGRGEA